MSDDAWSDKRIETIIASLLRAGVAIAMIVVLAGGIAYVRRHGSARTDLHSFHGEPASLRSVLAIGRDAFRPRSLAVIQLGLLLLILTPIARVVLSVFAFALERDWLYVGVTLLVLALLLYSFLGLN